MGQMQFTPLSPRKIFNTQGVYNRGYNSVEGPRHLGSRFCITVLNPISISHIEKIPIGEAFDLKRLLACRRNLLPSYTSAS